MPSASAAMEMRPPSRHLQRVDEAQAFLAQQIFIGHMAVAEDDFGRVTGAHT